MALLQAAVAFSPSSGSGGAGGSSRAGARFCTYAGTAVFRRMLRALHNCGRMVRLPARWHQTMVQVGPEGYIMFVFGCSWHLSFTLGLLLVGDCPAGWGRAGPELMERRA